MSTPRTRSTTRSSPAVPVGPIGGSYRYTGKDAVVNVNKDSEIRPLGHLARQG